MKRIWMVALVLAALLTMSASAAPAEVLLTAEPAAAAVGDVVDVKTEGGDGAVSVIYTLRRNGENLFSGKEDAHFDAAFRPRAEGTYTLAAEVHYEDGRTESAECSVKVSGSAEEKQGPDTVYSQKDGWWKDKEYGKSELDNAGCAIFTLSHALQRMGWTGEEIEPETLAVTYKNCYTKNGTAVARLVYNASQVYGYSTRSSLQKDKASLREGLKNGDYYSFAIVLGHIALMTGIDEKEGKVHVVDSAPSATFERIKKGKIYILQDGAYLEVKDPGEIPGARYYFETGYYGGLEYWMDLEYCARRGGRLIRPTWLFYLSETGKIGADMVTLSSGESRISVNGQEMSVPTRELSWGDDGKPRLAAVTQQKAVKLLNAEGKRIASVPGCSVLPVLREEEDQVQVMYEDQRGYLKRENVEVLEPLQGEIRHGMISVNGNTSGRATVKLRYGPSEKERVADNWKTGTEVILIRQEEEFWQIEARGVRLWVHQDYVTASP